MSPATSQVKPALIGVDWGTTTFRAHLLCSQGSVLAETSTNQGILQLGKDNFAPTLKHHTSTWLQNSSLPIVLSGMVTSRNGWQETAYLPAPCSAIDFANALVKKTSDVMSDPIYFVTGVSCETASDYPDVLRGEETEIIGHINTTGMHNACYILPGTHSKWVSVENANITTFSTCMTGELFAVMRQHSILAKTAGVAANKIEQPFSNSGFTRGVETAFANPNLLQTLFSARSLALFDRLDPAHAADYMSGLLIGTEVSSMLDRQQSTGHGHATDAPLVIIGRGDLAARYEAALQLANRVTTRSAAGMAAHGHFQIAQLAGLIH